MTRYRRQPAAERGARGRRSAAGGNLDTERRLVWLRTRLRSDGRIQISSAAEHLGVSEMTVRRDLDELAATGVVRRVRGGAVAVAPLSFGERHRQGARAKARIAAKLAHLVPESGAVGVDGSSTMLRLVTAIDGARGLAVLTHGIETFQALQGKPGLTPLLTGGRVDPRTGSLVGPLASRSVSALLLARLFMSAAAVDPSGGASETTLEEADVKAAMAASSAEVILGVDSSKLGTRAVAVAVEWDAVTLMVTELDPRDQRLDPYRELVKLA